MKLTPKQQAFVKHIVNNPKDSATEAAAQTYNVSDRNTAKSIATENLAKPAIKTELMKYNDTIENMLFNTIRDYQDSSKVQERALAVDTGKWIHDKIHGKATQRVEQHTTGVILTIDLTNALKEEQ
jgi:phage terminase small subunit